MRLLITGCDGFVGRHLTREAIARGWQVYGTVLSGRSMTTEIETFPVDLVSGDITTVIQRVKPDYLCHLAGFSSVALSWQEPAQTFQVNTIGTIRLLDAVRQVSPETKILSVGSAEEYGLVRSLEPITEEYVLQPLSPYGASKAAVGFLAQQYARAYDLHICHVRPFNHIGIGQGKGFVTTDFASQLVAMEKGLIAPILKVGNLEAKRDFTNVRDIVQGYLQLLQLGQRGQVYNLASGKAVAVQEVLDLMLKRIGTTVKVQVDTERLRPSEVPVLAGNIDKIKQLTGWQPKIDLEESVEEVLADWRSRL